MLPTSVHEQKRPCPGGMTSPASGSPCILQGSEQRPHPCSALSCHHLHLPYGVAVVLVAQLCQTFYNPIDCSPQAPLSMEFSRQEYWSGLPSPSPGDLSTPGMEPGSLALQADCHLSHQGGPHLPKRLSGPQCASASPVLIVGPVTPHAGQWS